MQFHACSALYILLSSVAALHSHVIYLVFPLAVIYCEHEHRVTASATVTSDLIISRTVLG